MPHDSSPIPDSLPQSQQSAQEVYLLLRELEHKLDAIMPLLSRPDASPFIDKISKRMQRVHGKFMRSQKRRLSRGRNSNRAYSAEVDEEDSANDGQGSQALFTNVDSMSNDGNNKDGHGNYMDVAAEEEGDDGNDKDVEEGDGNDKDMVAPRQVSGEVMACSFLCVVHNCSEGESVLSETLRRLSAVTGLPQQTELPSISYLPGMVRRTRRSVNWMG
jgi:hypothetical protein